MKKKNKYPFSKCKKIVYGQTKKECCQKYYESRNRARVMLALCFLGRTGKQTHFHFLQMIYQNKDIINSRKIIAKLAFDFFMHRYF